MSCCKEACSPEKSSRPEFSLAPLHLQACDCGHGIDIGPDHQLPPPTSGMGLQFALEVAQSRAEPGSPPS